MNIFTAEIEAYDPDTSSVMTYRFSSHGYIDAGTNYEPRIKSAPRFSRSVRSVVLGGRSDQSYGELQLNNGDHALDGMRADFFDGRKCTIKYGDQSASYGAFAVVMVAKIASIGFEGSMISVRLRDRSNELDKVFSTATYGGTNALPLGVDGTADDIKGQYRPYLFGRVAHCTPVFVNTSKLIYEVSASAVDDIVNVFDAGAYLSRGMAYTSQSDMETNQPASGTWRYWISSGGSYIRLGASSFGSITCTVAEKWTHTQISAAGILSRLFTAIGWSSGTDYVSADLTTLDQKCCGPLGIVVQPGETIISLIDRIAGTVGAWWGFDALSRFRIARMDAPSAGGTALSDVVLQNIEGQANDDEIPWRITIPSDQNYAVQQKTSLAGVAQAVLARVAWIESETRNQIASDASVKTSRITATEQTHAGFFSAISQAQAEATRRLGMLKVRRDVNTGTLLDYLTYSSIDLGSSVAVQSNELGYSVARDMIVVGMDVNLETNSADLTLWG